MRLFWSTLSGWWLRKWLHSSYLNLAIRSARPGDFNSLKSKVVSFYTLLFRFGSAKVVVRIKLKVTQQCLRLLHIHETARLLRVDRRENAGFC